MIVIVLVVLIYGLSVFGMYKYVQKLYSKNGIYDDANVNGFDLFMCICPMVNTSVCILAWIFICPTRNSINKKEVDYNKIFKIKKS